MEDELEESKGGFLPPAKMCLNVASNRVLREGGRHHRRDVLGESAVGAVAGNGLAEHLHVALHALNLVAGGIHVETLQ